MSTIKGDFTVGASTMVATPAPSKVWGLDDFLAMPETKPASEYIHGKIIQKPMPGGKHSLIQTKFASRINQCGEPNKIALALIELRCSFADRSIVPDIAVIRWENLPMDEDGEISDRFHRPPDWIIEILSPEQSATMVMEKIVFCLEQGAELGWLIDPQGKSVWVMPSSGLPKIYLMDKNPTDAIVMMAGFESWQLSLNDIFAWLKV